MPEGRWGVTRGVREEVSGWGAQVDVALSWPRGDGRSRQAWEAESGVLLLDGAAAVYDAADAGSPPSNY